MKTPQLREFEYPLVESRHRGHMLDLHGNVVKTFDVQKSGDGWNRTTDLGIMRPSL